MKWSELIPPEIKELGNRLANQASEIPNLCPPAENIFRALTLTPPEKTKVVIVGQDPYHTPGVANGLAFSVSPRAKIPPSLVNIFKEAKSDLGWDNLPTCGDLTPWAERGVLLINTTLTTIEHQPNAHSNVGWDKFTGAILDAAVHLPQPIVFILWGANAISLMNRLLVKANTPGSKPGTFKQNLIKKYIICSSHPSPLGAHRPCKGMPSFMNSKPFSTANEFLIEGGSDPIDWTL